MVTHSNPAPSFFSARTSTLNGDHCREALGRFISDHPPDFPRLAAIVPGEPREQPSIGV